MKNFLKNFMESRTAAIVMMLLYALLMGIATVVEEYHTTAAAKALIYYSPLFMLLQLLMVANFIGVSLKYRMFRPERWGYLLVHGAFVVILTGAAVTHFFSRDGMMSIREGEMTDEIVVGNAEDWHIKKLPFQIELTDFRLIRYPGSHSPSSYESDLKVHADGEVIEAKVYMNHVLDFKGYRFFQSSYDQDEKGTILSVSHDRAGRSITYTGYVLLLLGLIGCLVSPKSRFRQLIRQLDKGVAATLFVALAALSAGKEARADGLEIPAEHAAAFGRLPMQSPQGRIVPVNTFALEILHKLQVEEIPFGFDENQFLLSVSADPSGWTGVPLVMVDDKELRGKMAQGRQYMSYLEAFDEKGDYRFQTLVEEAYHKGPSERSLSDKELLKVDERLNILHLLFQGQLLNIMPGGNEGKTWIPYSPLWKEYLSAVVVAAHSGQWSLADQALERVSALQIEQLPELEKMQPHLDMEVAYNGLNLLKHSRRIYLIVGGLLLVLSFATWSARKECRATKVIRALLMTAVAAGVLLHAGNMGMRWYISGHVPLSNSYETMVLLAWTTVLGGFCFSRKSMVAFSLATLFGGVILFVSELNWMDPQITPLVPVLKSPWLMFHVAFMMISYGFLGIGAVLGIIDLLLLACRPKGTASLARKSLLEHQVGRLSIINEMSLCLGLCFMVVGIFLGAVWANESWGTYWSWDPKETWALITTVIYAAVLHWRWFARKRNDLIFNILSQWAILAVLMTYFGVNYLLSGMHSYGDTTLFNDFPMWIFGLAGLFFVLPGAAALVNQKLNR